MRKLLLLILTLPTTLQSQIMLTVNDFADGGDTVRMSIADNVGYDFSLTGANYSWDFSGLVATEQELKDFRAMSQASALANLLFGGFQPQEYQATNFASSTDLPLEQIGTILPVSITDINMFSKNASDSITTVGYSVVVEGTEIPFKSDTIETRYKFPMNYGDAFNSRGYFKLDMNPIQNAIWIQYKQRHSEVDGWGSITTPYGTFNVLRVKHVINELDSLMFEVFGTPTWVPIPVPELTVYEWWTNGEKEPILRTKINVINGTPTVRSIEYRDNYDPQLAELTEEQIQIGLYPNPVVDELHICTNTVGDSYFVYSSNGSLLMNGFIDGNETTLDLSKLKSGTYLFVLKDANGFISESFVKK